MPEKSFLGTLNKIESLWENPCGISWWAYVRTAFPAAGGALRMLITPQPDEILEEYLDPKDSRKGPRRRDTSKRRRRLPGGGGKIGKGFSGLFNLDNLIGDHLPGAESFSARQISKTEHLFWTGLNSVDRGLWYWMLYDVGQDFVYNWHSGIHESRFCSEQANAWGSWELLRDTNPNNTQAPPQSPPWVEIDSYGYTLNEHNQIKLPAPSRCRSSYSMHFDRVDSTGPDTARIWTRVWYADGTDVVEDRLKQLEFGEGVDFDIQLDTANVVQIQFGGTYQTDDFFKFGRVDFYSKVEL